MEQIDKQKKTGKANIKLNQYYLACILSNNAGDISKIGKLEYADFWTYSFPCTDISVAGKQAGINENTRSGLLYEVERLLRVSAEHNELPKYLMLENVKNLVGKQFKSQFDEWIAWLDNLGYNTYWEVLNAKNYGIPQNRERVFAISIRKNIDDKEFQFPEPFDNGLRLKDFLEPKVDEKYYISQELTDKLLDQIENKEISNTVRGGGERKRRQAQLGSGKGIIISEQARKFNKATDSSTCLLSRDYKGFGNQEMTAVLEVDEDI